MLVSIENGSGSSAKKIMSILQSWQLGKRDVEGLSAYQYSQLSTVVWCPMVPTFWPNGPMLARNSETKVLTNSLYIYICICWGTVPVCSDDAIDGFIMTRGLRRDAKGDRVTVSIEFHEPEGLCRGFACLLVCL